MIPVVVSGTKVAETESELPSLSVMVTVMVCGRSSL